MAFRKPKPPLARKIPVPQLLAQRANVLALENQDLHRRIRERDERQQKQIADLRQQMREALTRETNLRRRLDQRERKAAGAAMGNGQSASGEPS